SRSQIDIAASSKIISSPSKHPTITTSSSFSRSYNSRTAKMTTNVALETSMGTIVLELYTAHAPKTCTNFSTLASRGYYNDTVIHRIIPNFMVQAGDPTGTGRGGTSIYGEKFADEIHPSLKHTGAGVLSMANAGPDTNGSQFFITLAPTPWLDGKHTIFGRVKNGLSVVKRMGLVKTGPEDRPLEEVKILRASVVEERGADDE
ncbi:peptidyl-prolyl cis-trans isomerase-like 1, partial [Colletotrichum incanum]